MSRSIVNCVGREFQGAFAITYAAEPDGVWDPPTFSYPAAGLYDPRICVETANPDSHYDRAINDTGCLVFSNSIGLLGATVRVAYAVWDDVATVRGRISAQGKIKTLTLLESSPDTHGIFCLASGDLAPGEGGKAFALLVNDVAEESRVFLVQVNDGLDASIGQEVANSYTVLAQTVQDDFVTGTREPHGFALAWESDPVLLRGVRLRAYFDEALLWDFITTGADAYVPTTTVGAGVFATAITHETIHYFDNVQGFGV